ncbi:MAG: hypothetical protein WBO24_13800, partial [Nitrospirales bacterium]
GNVGGASRIAARVRLGSDPSQGPCPERSRMDQDDNAGNTDGCPMTFVMQPSKTLFPAPFEKALRRRS